MIQDSDSSPSVAPAPAAVPARTETLLAILEEAVERRASDVLLTVGAPILWRLDGLLVPAGVTPLTNARAQSELYGILLQEQIARFERERELDFSLRIAGAHRYRGNAYWQRGGVAAAFRLVPSKMPTLGELGLPERVALLLQEPRGLVLVTGATGQGKSTTLAAMVSHINRTRPVHVITIEDPIEFEHNHGMAVVDQREVGTDTESFGQALRRVIRQSPDVIMVGEMRDRETIGSALTAAETGHLVLATLHTNDAAQTVDRIVDVFEPAQQPQVRGQLSQVLSAVISQRLLPRADGNGRVLACEMLVATSAVRNMIRSDKTHNLHTAIETGIQEGMQPLDHSLRALVRAGVVTLEVAAVVARDPGRLR